MIPKKIAILQSNYIPWKGYFDLINKVEEFILYDDVQFSKGDWRNRNQIKTSTGVKWLTIPLLTKGKLQQAIKDVEINEADWAIKHWKTICQNYSRAPFFKKYKDLFEELYHRCLPIKKLSEVNYLFMTEICQVLGIKTKIRWSMEFELLGDRNERLVNLCKAVNANQYLSGPAAKSYIDLELFKKSDIEVEFMDYSGYLEYPQLHGEFTHNVTILDLLFQVGPDITSFMKSFNSSLPK